MEAREFLEQLTKLDMMIENKQIEKEQWKAIALNVTAKYDGERVQSSGSQQKMSDAIEKYIEIETEINACIDELIEIKKDVISVIEQLPAAEYDIIHKIYVQHLTLYDVTAMSDRSYSAITTLHGRALKSVQKILNERKCSDEVSDNLSEV